MFKRSKRRQTNKIKRKQSRMIKSGGAYEIEKCDQTVMNSEDYEPITYDKYSDIDPENLVKLHKQCFEANALLKWLTKNQSNPYTREPVLDDYVRALRRKVNPPIIMVSKIKSYIKRALKNQIFNILDFSEYHYYRYEYFPEIKEYRVSGDDTKTLSLYDIELEQLLFEAINEENEEAVTYLYQFGNWNIVDQQPSPLMSNLLSDLVKENRIMKSFSQSHSEPMKLFYEIKPTENPKPKISRIPRKS